MFFRRLLVYQHVLLIHLSIFTQKVVNDDRIGDIVHQSHEKGPNYQPEERFVVLGPDTVVDPPAVVVEFIHAAIAGATVLRGFKHVSVAHLAHKIVFVAVKPLVLGFTQALRPDGWVRGVHSSGYIPVV